MTEIDATAAAQWVEVNGQTVPQSLNTGCPHCRRLVNLNCAGFQFDERRLTVSASSTCPSCRKTVHFWSVMPVKTKDVPNPRPAHLMMFPGNKATHRPVEGAERLPDGLRRSYHEAIQVFNAGVWSATTTLCRRTLEGLVKKLSGPGADEKTLNKMLEELPQKIDLQKPVTALAHAVRVGGNLGAHFDENAEPDEELARTMLSLLDYLLEYFYTIPRLIEDAEKTLAKHK